MNKKPFLEDGPWIDALVGAAALLEDGPPVLRAGAGVSGRDAAGRFEGGRRGRCGRRRRSFALQDRIAALGDAFIAAGLALQDGNQVRRRRQRQRRRRSRFRLVFRGTAAADGLRWLVAVTISIQKLYYA